MKNCGCVLADFLLWARQAFGNTRASSWLFPAESLKTSTEDLTRTYSVRGQQGSVGMGARSRSQAFLGFICLYPPQTRESVSGKKTGILATWSPGVRNTTFLPPENLEFMMANTDNRGQHLYQASGSQGTFPCVISHTQTRHK